jgi:hypothetical protein
MFVFPFVRLFGVRVFPEEDNDDRLILHLYDKMYDLNYQIVSILFVAVFQQYLHTI